MNVTSNCTTAESVAANVSAIIKKGYLITTKQDVTLASNVINNIVGNISFSGNQTSDEVQKVNKVLCEHFFLLNVLLFCWSKSYRVEIHLYRAMWWTIFKQILSRKISEEKTMVLTVKEILVALYTGVLDTVLL